MSEAVRKRREQQIADHQAGQGGGEDRPKQFPWQAPFLGDKGRHVADGLGVETIQEHDECAQDNDYPLNRADASGIDERRHVKRGFGDTHGFHPR